MEKLSPIIQVGDVLVSPDLFTEMFCCDLSVCRGACCVEGDAGAPVTEDELLSIEDALDDVWPLLSASAQAEIDKNGVAYVDREGDLVTSIVGGKDCVFTCYDVLTDALTGQTVDGCCLCAFEKLHRRGLLSFVKPASCALYPVRQKTFGDGTVGLNYHRWAICEGGRKKGQQLRLPLYRFLEGPLRRQFGDEWYAELCECARQLEPYL